MRMIHSFAHIANQFHANNANIIIGQYFLSFNVFAIDRQSMFGRIKNQKQKAR